MSPPWFTSTTSASASSRRHSAIAFAAQPAGESPPPSRRRARRSCRPRRGRPPPGRRHRRPCPLDAGGSTATTMRASGGAASTRQVSMQRARPQRVGAVLDDLAVDLLAAEPRAGIARQHVLEKRRRQMQRVRPRARARHRGRRIGDQPLEQRDRPRRGGDHLPRPLAKAQPELQHVEGRFGMAPLGELVRPGGMELRAAQALRILGGKRLRHRAVAPFDAPARGNPGRPLVAADAPRAVRRRPRSSPRARRARSRRSARCGRPAGRHKAARRAPARAPIRRRRASCRRRGRRE